LDIQSRGADFNKQILADLPIELNVFNACVAIYEVKNFDSHGGGNTGVAIIKQDGFQMIPDNVVVEIYDKYVDSISTLFSRGLMDKNAEEMFRNFFKR
jgi:hypothetical protein